MSLWKIAWRSIQQRALASWLTGLSMALGVALVVLVLVIHGVVSRKFSEAAQGYHLLVGKKGGSYQLVLNTIFHMGKQENIPYNFYKQFITYEENGRKVRGRYAKIVDVAVPYCLGDSYDNYRVVGTTPDLFEKLAYGSYSNGDPKTYQCTAGRFFRSNEDFGAVVGYVAAQNTDLGVLGKEFKITHSVPEEGATPHVHDERFKVVGILAPTGTPNDYAVFVNIKGFFALEGHEGLPEGVKPYTESPTDEPAGVGEAHKHDHDHDHDHGKADAKGDDHAHDHKDEAKASKDGHDHEKADAGKDAAKHDHDHEKADAKGPDHKHDQVKAGAKSATEHDHSADQAKTAKADDHAKHDHGHDHAHHHHEVPDSEREVTSVLLLMKTDMDAMNLAKVINKGNVAQAVSPAAEVTQLMQGMVGTVRWILLILAVLVVIVAGIGVMVSIYNSMSDRRRDIAIMRSLGASRDTVMFVVLLESIMLSILGGLAGVVLAHVTIGIMSNFIVRQTGVWVSMWQLEPIELVVVPCLIILASIVGLLPALAAYRTDVAKALSSAP